MSEPDKKFDGNIQMMVEQPSEVNMARLRFMRWLAEQGALEHSVAGPSSGEFADAAEPSVVEPTPSV
jgi:hypothetical protein